MPVHVYLLNGPMPPACRGGAVTIGNFDGVHLGHQSLLAETVRQARAAGTPSVAVTFDPHPSQILRPDRTGPFLNTLDDRTTLLLDHGIDHVLVLQTTSALLRLSAREFFDAIIIGQLRATALVEGFNFGFGRGREGTIDMLRTWCAEKSVPLTLLPPREVLGQAVSSSRVRNELLAGDVALVRQLLGRPYRIRGIVREGAKRGATLGFPTANLHDIPTLIPANGVYAVRAAIAGKEETLYLAAANVGPNPTFGENARKVEVHLLDFSGTIYGAVLRVDFIQKIRDTRPFGNVQELTAQIQTDIARAREILAA